MCIDKRNTNQQIILEFSKNVLFIHVVDHIIKKFVLNVTLRMQMHTGWSLVGFFTSLVIVLNLSYTCMYTHFLNTTQQIITS